MWIKVKSWSLHPLYPFIWSKTRCCLKLWLSTFIHIMFVSKVMLKPFSGWCISWIPILFIYVQFRFLGFSNMIFTKLVKIQTPYEFLFYLEYQNWWFLYVCKQLFSWAILKFSHFYHKIMPGLEPRFLALHTSMQFVTLCNQELDPDQNFSVV